MNNGKRSEIKTKRKMCDDAKSNNHIRFRLNKKQESILGNQKFIFIRNRIRKALKAQEKVQKNF